MRQPFFPPTRIEFARVLNGSAGVKKGGGLGDISIFRPSVYRRGGGLFSMLKGVAKTAIPFLFKNVLPALANAGANVATDMSEGKKFKHALKTRGVEAFHDVRKRVAKGGGRKRKVKRCCKKQVKKSPRKQLSKQYKGDIFAHM